MISNCPRITYIRVVDSGTLKVKLLAIRVYSILQCSADKGRYMCIYNPVYVGVYYMNRNAVLPSSGEIEVKAPTSLAHTCTAATVWTTGLGHHLTHISKRAPPPWTAADSAAMEKYDSETYAISRAAPLNDYSYCIRLYKLIKP